MIHTFANGKEIVVFGSPFCKYCRRAKALLSELNHGSWIYINLEEQDISLEDQLKESTGQKTIPMVFMQVAGEYKFVGGFTELEKKLKP